MTTRVLTTRRGLAARRSIRRGGVAAFWLTAIFTAAMAGLVPGSARAEVREPHRPPSIVVPSPAPARPRPEPPGHRDPALQPFSSYSLWNTAIGADARWSAAGDADTRDLRRPHGTIAAGEWSIPVFVTAARDPLVPFRVTDRLFPLTTMMQHLPEGAAPSPPAEGGDHHMTLVEPDKRHISHYFGCRTQGRGYVCDLGQRDDVCGDGLGDYGWGSGLIRAWEIKAGAIHHVLRYSLSTAATKAGPTWQSGVAWPATRSDYEGPRSYKGHVLYGSTVGIPSTVDVTTLGLSGPGLVLARALQDYGAIQRDTGGDHGINFYAEQDAEGMPALDLMRADLDKIIPRLAVLRNQSPGSVNGGGARRQPTLPGIDRTVCP